MIESDERKLADEFRDLLEAAKAHLDVHPCTPKPCETEIRLRKALEAFGIAA